MWRGSLKLRYLYNQSILPGSCPLPVHYKLPCTVLVTLLPLFCGVVQCRSPSLRTKVWQYFPSSQPAGMLFHYCTPVPYHALAELVTTKYLTSRFIFLLEHCEAFEKGVIPRRQPPKREESIGIRVLLKQEERISEYHPCLICVLNPNILLSF